MPSINPWLILGVVATVIGAYFTGGFVENGRCNTRWELKTEKDKKDAVELALNIERANQGKANAALRQQAADQAAINNRLRADLAGLRNRPERPADLSANPRPACSGANGPELARLDAEFLIQFAALAAEQDAGLTACYAVIDGVRQ